jgi:hypothetical protein
LIVIKVEAEDKDEGKNAQVVFSITHISNNGTNKFRINETSGMIESVGKFNTGDQFSITVQVCCSLIMYYHYFSSVVFIINNQVGESVIHFFKGTFLIMVFDATNSVIGK